MNWSKVLALLQAEYNKTLTGPNSIGELTSFEVNQLVDAYVERNGGKKKRDVKEKEQPLSRKAKLKKKR